MANAHGQQPRSASWGSEADASGEADSTTAYLDESSEAYSKLVSDGVQRSPHPNVLKRVEGKSTIMEVSGRRPRGRLACGALSSACPAHRVYSTRIANIRHGPSMGRRYLHPR